MTYYEHLNVDLDEIPEVKDLLIPFCNRDRFDRQALGSIKLAFLRDQQASDSATTEHGDG